MKEVILFFALLCTISSCMPRLFFPDRVSNTQFTDKGQALLNATIKPQIVLSHNNGTDTLRSKSSSYSFDGAYSFHKNLAFSIYYSNIRDRGVLDELKNTDFFFYNGKRVEGAIIYFKPINKYWIAEYGLGIGKGTINRVQQFSNASNFTSKYNTISLNAAYSFKSDYFVASFGSKFMLQHHYDFTTNDLLIRSALSSKSNPPRDVTQYPFGFLTFYNNVEFGYKFFKLNMQSGLPLQILGAKASGWPICICFGLTFRFQKEYFINNAKTK